MTLTADCGRTVDQSDPISGDGVVGALTTTLRTPYGPFGSTKTRLLGRDAECAALERFVALTGEPCSRTLVLKGEGGVGKSALLDHLASTTPTRRVLRAGGREAEAELAYAGVQQLCASIVDRIDLIPPPQREALATAIGLTDGPVPDPFYVGLGMRALLVESSCEQPLLCLVDDFQWLDKRSAETFAFVARRLQAEPIVMVLAKRLPNSDSMLLGLPELHISGLGDAHSRTLLRSALLAPLDPDVAEQLLAEIQGNPLTLLELPRRLAANELAGGFGLLRALPVDFRLAHALRRRIAELPPETQQLLLLAAADPLGDTALLWKAAAQLGAGPNFAEAAEVTGLVNIGPRVRFRHPLVRSIIYHAASGEDRRATHQALAEATDPVIDADRRAWHRAAAVSGTNEDIAMELEGSADRASSRGGAPAAAAFLARAVELSTDPTKRSARALAAARESIEAGAPNTAHELLRVAVSCPLNDLEGAEVDRLRAELAFLRSRGGDAPAFLMTAARNLDPVDASLALDTYLQALLAAQFADRLTPEVDVLEVARAALAALGPSECSRPSELLLKGLALRFVDGIRVGAPLLQRALRSFKAQGLLRKDLRWLVQASNVAMELWDDESWEILSGRLLQMARDTGTLAVLPLALMQRIAMHALVGELKEGESLVDEANAILSATGFRIAPYGELFLTAWKGQEGPVHVLIAAAERDAIARGEGAGLAVTEWAEAMLASAGGQYGQALELAERASERRETLGVSTWALIEVIEASSRLGHRDRATDALERLSESTSMAGTNWALGVQERSRALVSDHQDAERHYRLAIELLGQTRVCTELARSHLMYGEWLRRRKRRVDARTQLRIAHDLFVSMGVRAFSERARRELCATGETVRKRSVDTALDLTPQERRIAELAGDLHQNSEIAAQLFLSPRTVEWHLRKVFTKLAITSRRELRNALERQPKPPEQMRARTTQLARPRDRAHCESGMPSLIVTSA